MRQVGNSYTYAHDGSIYVNGNRKGSYTSYANGALL